MNTLDNLIHAARFASEKHAGQLRKGARSEPYINHPIEVAHLIANIGLVTDLEIVIGGLLHDTIEDTDTSEAEIADIFGPVVCGYVLEVTDDTSLPKHRRKELQIEHAPHMSPGAKMIKLADKISNIRDVVENPAIGWDIGRRRDYVLWGEQVVAGLRGANRLLEDHFDRLIERANSTLY